MIEGVRRLRVSVLAGFGELRGGWAGLPAARSTVDVPAEHGRRRAFDKKGFGVEPSLSVGGGHMTGPFR